MKAIITKLNIIAILIILTLTACDNAKQMSEREEQLFAQDYHSLVIPIDSLSILNDLIIYFDDTYCINESKEWPLVYLDMKTKELVSKSNRNTIAIGIEPAPCVKGQIQYDDHMILEIIKDGYNTEIEQIITEVDSIPSFVRKQMLSWGVDPNYAVGARGNGIWICTKKEDKLSSLNIYIYNVVIGYLSSVREYSHLAYNKSIDELSEADYQEIANEFVFSLAFKYTDKDIEINFGKVGY